jgi:hypothetical protein
MIGKAVYAQLAASVGVTALVGDRIWPQAKPGLTNYPALVYDAGIDEAIVSYSGDSGLKKFLVPVRAIARTYAEAQQLAEAVRTALTHHGRVTWGTIVIQGSFFENSEEERITIPDDEETVFESIVYTFTVWAEI